VSRRFYDYVYLFYCFSPRSRPAQSLELRDRQLHMVWLGDTSPLKDLALTCHRSRSAGLRARESECCPLAVIACLVYVLPRFVPDIIERTPDQHSQLLTRRDQHPPRFPLRSIYNARPLLLGMARQIHNSDRLDSSRHVDLRLSYPLVALPLALLHNARHI